MTDSATMSDHEQARKDDEDDRVHEAAKEYLPECALEFVCTREGLGKLLDGDDQWLDTLADVFEKIDRADREWSQGAKNLGAMDDMLSNLYRLRALARGLAEDHEDVCIAAQKRVTDRG